MCGVGNKLSAECSSAVGIKCDLWSKLTSALICACFKGTEVVLVARATRVNKGYASATLIIVVPTTLLHRGAVTHSGDHRKSADIYLRPDKIKNKIKFNKSPSFWASFLVTFGRTRRQRLAATEANRLTLIEIVESIARAIAATVGEGLAALTIAIVVVAGLPLCAGSRRHRFIANIWHSTLINLAYEHLSKWINWLTDTLELAALALALVTGLKAITITTTAAIDEGGAEHLLIVIEPGGGTVVALSGLSWLCAHWIGLKQQHFKYL